MKASIRYTLISDAVWSALNGSNVDRGILGSEKRIGDFSLSNGDYYPIPSPCMV